MNRLHPLATCAALGLAVLLLASCSPRLGWGLILWSAPEGPLAAGSVAPVYIKSNIQKVYVVGVPGLKGKDKNKKIELPLWQLELFPTRGAAAARAKAMGPNASLYMIAARDGLPLRDTPSNGGKRVYRLREGQSVKVLEKAQGEVVSTGGQVLPGSWYLVLADDGTRGYVFSYALRLYDEAKEGPPVLAAAKLALSGRVDLIFSRSWRPDYFQEMIDDGRIDLDYFSLRFGVFVDAIRRQVRIELPAASKVFNYASVSETEGLYAFEGTPLRIRIESDRRMVCYWTDEAAAGGAEADQSAQGAAPSSPAPAEAPIEGYSSAGSGGSAIFAVLASEPRETIRLEALRRQKLLTSFVDGIGGAWVADSGGAPSADPGANPGGSRLEIAKNGRFTWKGRGEAEASLVPPGAGESGEITFRLFLDTALAASWNGSFSLRFDQAEADKSRQAWSDLLYRRSPAGLVLASASPLPASLLVTATNSKAEPLVLAPAAGD